METTICNLVPNKSPCPITIWEILNSAHKLVSVSRGVSNTIDPQNTTIHTMGTPPSKKVPLPPILGTSYIGFHVGFREGSNRRRRV